ncbi:hypothetical protein HPB48_022644 [Haemaphysalis longicornis]|uniref:Uncharacterized protein n=1 Tax=Haemaphysalis longicornis TaxID=44386 RepID=A0A9J6GKD5_HAELO|nr:hypothetical protein HPB48_022644 [Haemaphysalis longicornis]
MALEHCETSGENSGGAAPSLLPLLSRFSVEMKNTLVSQLLAMGDELCGAPEAQSLRPASHLVQETSEVT